METQTLAPRDLVRQAVIEVAQLPDNELLVVIEIVDQLKKQRARPHRQQAADLVARAKARAVEMSLLSREALMQEFSETLGTIRAEAIAKGTALEGEWEGG